MFILSPAELTNALAEQTFKQCINYFQPPFALATIDCGSPSNECVEILKTLKIKHVFTQTTGTLFIKSDLRDIVLVFYLISAKLYLEREEGWINELDYILEIYLDNHKINPRQNDLSQFILFLDSTASRSDQSIECIFYINLYDANHANEFRAMNLYLVEDGYDWFLDEQRRQNLIERGLLPPIKY